MPDIKEGVKNKLMYLEKKEPLLYAAIKKRTKDPIDYIATIVAEQFDNDKPGDYKAAMSSLNAAIELFKLILAGNVYKK